MNQRLYFFMITSILCLNGIPILYLNKYHFSSVEEITAGAYEKDKTDIKTRPNTQNQQQENVQWASKPKNTFSVNNLTSQNTSRSAGWNTIQKNIKPRKIFQSRQMLMLNKSQTTTKRFTKNDFALTMKERVANIKDVCHRTSMFSVDSFSIPKNLFILPDKNLIYCPVFKAASSFWINTLFELEKDRNELKTKMAKAMYPDDLINQAKFLGIYNPLSRFTDLTNLTTKIIPFPNSNTTGFLVVRHPFERLVSAFRDKLERTHGNNDYYYITYGKNMVQQFRDNALEIFGRGFFDSSNNFGALLPVSGNRRTDAKLPTFWEFVQSLLHPAVPGMGMDEHWTPIYHYCSICEESHLAVYNSILKFEDLETEQPAFLKHVLKTKSILNAKSRNKNRPNGISSYEVTKLYFSILSHSDIQGLYQLYKPDFMLFNYEFNRGDFTLPSSRRGMPL